MEVPPLVQLLKLAGGGRYRESRDGSPAQPPHSAARWDAAGFGVGCLAEPACGDTRSLAIPAGRTPVPCLSAGRAVLPLGRTAPGAESGARFCPHPPWVPIFLRNPAALVSDVHHVTMFVPAHHRAAPTSADTASRYHAACGSHCSVQRQSLSAPVCRHVSS